MQSNKNHLLSYYILTKYEGGVFMPAYPAKNIRIYGSSLEKGGAFKENIIFRRSNRTLIKGMVMDESGKPIEGIGIEIVLIYSSCEGFKKRILGTVFSDENGIYAASLRVKAGYKYIINLYSCLLCGGESLE